MNHRLLDRRLVEFAFLGNIQPVELGFHERHPLLLRYLAPLVRVHEEEQLLDVLDRHDMPVRLPANVFLCETASHSRDQEQCDEEIPSFHRLPPALNLVAIRAWKEITTPALLLDGTDRIYLWRDAVQVITCAVFSAELGGVSAISDLRQLTVLVFTDSPPESWSKAQCRITVMAHRPLDTPKEQWRTDYIWDEGQEVEVSIDERFYRLSAIIRFVKQ